MRQNGTSATSKSNATASRRGVALVMFVILVFAFMAMAALSIDLGMASLAQAQMQNAVDHAAVEGLATRDFSDYRPDSNLWRRRFLAPHAVRYVFDDDFAPATDQRHFAAGPNFRLHDGIGNVNAAALIETPADNFTSDDRYLDDPQLQENRFNLAHGDMLSGTYLRTDSHVETPGTYARTDFRPASQFGTPLANAFESWQSICFLARMRRTRVAGLPDAQTGVSSRGPVLPFLFGMGTTVHAAEGSTFNPRRDGIAIRATAIAAGGPVLSVGPPLLDDSGAAIERKWYYPNGVELYSRSNWGVGPILLKKEYWISDLPEFTDSSAAALAANSRKLKVRRSTGEVLRDNSPLPPDVVGRLDFGDRTNVGNRLSPYSPAWIDQLTAEWFPSLQIGRCYIPLYAPISVTGSGTSDRIVGYVHGTIRQDTPDPDPDLVVITVARGFSDQDESAYLDSPCAVLVAPENATVNLTAPDTSLDADGWTQVFDELIDLTYPDGVVSYEWRDVRNGALLAPALVR